MKSNEHMDRITRAWTNHNSENGTSSEELLLLFQCGLLDELSVAANECSPVTIRRNSEGAPEMYGQPELRKKLIESGVEILTVPGIGLVPIPPLSQEEKSDEEYLADISYTAYQHLPKWARVLLRKYWDTHTQTESTSILIRLLFAARTECDNEAASEQSEASHKWASNMLDAMLAHHDPTCGGTTAAHAALLRQAGHPMYQHKLWASP